MAHTLARAPLNKPASSPPTPAAAAAEKAVQWRRQAEEYETFAGTLSDYTLKAAYRDLATDLRARADRFAIEPISAARDIALADTIRKTAADCTDLSLRREMNAAATAIERGEAR